MGFYNFLLTDIMYVFFFIIGKVWVTMKCPINPLYE